MNRTSKYVAPYFNDFLAGIGQGDFLSDTVSVGGVSTKDLVFGYIDSYGFPSHLLPPTASIAGTWQLHVCRALHPFINTLIARFLHQLPGPWPRVQRRGCIPHAGAQEQIRH
jgi:hypothetical protein